MGLKVGPDCVGHRLDGVEIGSLHAYLYGSGRLIVHLLDAYQGFGEIMLVFLLVFREYGFGRLNRPGVYYELCVVGRGSGRGVGRGEARGAVAYERRDRFHAPVAQHHVLQRVHDRPGVLQAGIAVQGDFDCEEVPVGHGHHLDVELEEEHDGESHGSDSGRERHPGMAEAPVLCGVVGLLQSVEEFLLYAREDVVLLDVGAAYEPDLERRHHEYGVEERGGQGDCHDPGEVGHEVSEIAGDEPHGREEHQAQPRGRRDHGHHELACARLGRLFAGHALAQLSHIAVHRDYRVVDYHSEHHYQGGQRDRVEPDSGQVHDRQGDCRAHGHSGTCDERRFHGEEHQHHQNHDDH